MTMANGIDELEMLCSMLDANRRLAYEENHVPVDGKRTGKRNQIYIEHGGDRFSIVCHEFSYGGAGGFLECWNYSKDEEPEGYLTADEAYSWLRGHGLFKGE